MLEKKQKKIISAFSNTYAYKFALILLLLTAADPSMAAILGRVIEKDTSIYAINVSNICALCSIIKVF